MLLSHNYLRNKFEQNKQPDYSDTNVLIVMAKQTLVSE